MPPLPKVRDVNQPTITSFFTKSFKKQIGEIGLPKYTPKESNGKVNVVKVGSKEEEARKLLPRRSARAAQLSITLEPPVSKEKEVIDAPTQAKPAKEKERS